MLTPTNGHHINETRHTNRFRIVWRVLLWMVESPGATAFILITPFWSRLSYEAGYSFHTKQTALLEFTTGLNILLFVLFSTFLAVVLLIVSFGLLTIAQQRLIQWLRKKVEKAKV